MREMDLPNLIHAFVPHSLTQCRRIDDVGKDDRQRDAFVTRPFDESRAVRFGVRRQHESLEIPLAIGGQVHRLDQ
jgi:hypothetical protein